MNMSGLPNCHPARAAERVKAAKRPAFAPELSWSLQRGVNLNAADLWTILVLWTNCMS